MAFKFVLFAACLAAANAGYLGAPAAVGYAASPLAYAAPASYGYAAPAAYHGAAYAAPASYGYAAGVPSVSSVSQNTLRSFGNTAQVSTYSKALDTPFSSVRKTDTRITNDSPAYGYAAPAAYGYAAPAAYGYAAPAAYHGAAYAAPIAKVAAPLAYAAPAYHGAAYAAPAAYGYAAPAAYHGAAYAAPVAHVAHGALGVAYSAAPVVSHMSYSAPLINYAY